MNIYDISKITGFSTATVSRVINGSSNVSEKTREKVLAVIEEYGYTPNVFARGLGLNTMKTIGIMCTDSSDRYIAQAVYYLEENLREQNYDLILCCTGHDIHVKQKQMKLIMSKRVDAVILVGSSYVEETEEMCSYIAEAARSVPVMLINGILNAPNVFCTLCDDRSAMHDITRYTLSTGRNRPVYIYNSHSYSSKQKLAGFRDALDACGIAYSDDMLLYVPSDPSHSLLYGAKKALEERRPVFDCVIASEDLLAAGALKYAKARGMRIPEDVSITGFNDSDICECCDPELTSVDNKLETLCTQCVSSLMTLFSDRSAVPAQTVFTAEIKKRDTTF